MSVQLMVPTGEEHLENFTAANHQTDTQETAVLLEVQAANQEPSAIKPSENPWVNR